MKHAINLLPIIPVRKEPLEMSEMVTQLLFGETVTVIGEIEQKYKIRNYIDNYIGWIDKKMATLISEQEYKKITDGKPYRVLTAFAKIKESSSIHSMTLTCGSLVHFFNKREKSFQIAEHHFFLLEGELCLPEKINYSPAFFAQIFLNVPYLWGGKSMFGVDCSGFIQIVMSLFGCNLPRDSKDQSNEGIVVPFEKKRENDVAFFSTLQGNAITHVGIVIEKDKIIHASGKVKIDRLMPDGIFSEDSKSFTHKLLFIKRMSLLK